VKKIFLIDDDPVFVYLTKKIIGMTQYPCEITEFADGELAIVYLNTFREKTESLPDIIFLDLSMPVMDGWEFLNQYAEIRPGIRKEISLFIVSSSISPQEVERSKTFREVSDFLVKPLGKVKIAEIINSCQGVG
jgi:CheY-like chemotaxis protein